MISEYELAKEKLINLDLKMCEDYFRKNKLYLELGYCELLKGNLENSKKLFDFISFICAMQRFTNDLNANKFSLQGSLYSIRL